MKNIDKNYILQYLKSHKEEFKEKYNLEEMGLFGSFARDEENEKSDIDLFVKMTPDLFLISDLKTQVENDLQKKVDIILHHKHIKPLLLKMIQKDIINV
jgi:predicted nucleotidyltransferase